MARLISVSKDGTSKKDLAKLKSPNTPQNMSRPTLTPHLKMIRTKNRLPPLPIPIPSISYTDSKRNQDMMTSPSA